MLQQLRDLQTDLAHLRSHAHLPAFSESGPKNRRSGHQRAILPSMYNAAELQAELQEQSCGEPAMALLLPAQAPANVTEEQLSVPPPPAAAAAINPALPSPAEIKSAGAAPLASPSSTTAPEQNHNPTSRRKSMPAAAVQVPEGCGYHFFIRCLWLSMVY